MKLESVLRRIFGVLLLAVLIVSIFVIKTKTNYPFIPPLVAGNWFVPLMMYVCVIFGVVHSLVMIFDNRSLMLGWIPMGATVALFIVWLFGPAWGPAASVITAEWLISVKVSGIVLFLLPLFQYVDWRNFTVQE